MKAAWLTRIGYVLAVLALLALLGGIIWILAIIGNVGAAPAHGGGGAMPRIASCIVEGGGEGCFG